MMRRVCIGKGASVSDVLEASERCADDFLYLMARREWKGRKVKRKGGTGGRDSCGGYTCNRTMKCM